MNKQKQYKISKNRYLELLHYCRGYNEYSKYDDITNVDAQDALRHAHLCKMAIIESIVEQVAGSDSVMYSFLLKTIIGELSFKEDFDIPFSKDEWREAYYKFFYLLDRELNLRWAGFLWLQKQICDVYDECFDEWLDE